VKEIVVISGKGGTGKTSIVGSFAALAPRKALADCDVDAADLHLLLAPTPVRQEEFWSGQVAAIDPARCNECGLCGEVCRFNAIHGYQVDPIACEGCAFCYHVCPTEAIKMRNCLSGRWFVSDTRYGPLVHARLGIAEENSGKLVALVRRNARTIAKEQGLDYIITDGPPGIGCPVISSLTGADLALVVTEPTLSAIHDLERVLGVCRHFRIPAMTCINKHGLNEDNSARIEEYCRSEGAAVAARIPFDNVVTEAIVEGVPVVEFARGEVSRAIEGLWDAVSAAVGGD